MRTRLTLFAIVVLVLASAGLIPTLQLPDSEAVSTFIGPQLWPLSLLIALLLFGAFLLWETRKSAGKQSDLHEAGDEPEAAIPNHRLSIAASRHWYLMAATVIYTLMMQAIGFLPATALFALVVSWLLGARHWGPILATVAIAVVLIQGVFVLLLGIPLP
ncbi:tripartite tricarboxylate transporter TctB family protein [Halomonas huangheensis]|uniref:DUF1468 domain-containing protein n=1 Tax=Halomonas huangheensis TaxID=1178482 RepID=W1NC45_9GAMM|nr:tripartite tricarboxylate transporter TctB family protein [Halomonas huangheensis]ALM53016.1 hypothetical protein AR456_12510 [Halomonas huangheensis]ERL53053.1 hypothetical protein BJB45_17400 [Halomonas huangheensis]